jgi:Flp pilus assembly protein TadG
MKSQKGQSLVEFALVLPLLIFLLLGIIDFGRTFYVYSVMVNAGRETARAASIGIVNTDDSIKQYAVDSFNKNNVLNIDPLTKSDVQPPNDSEFNSATFFAGTDVGIQISYNETFLTPLISDIFKGMPLKNKTVMRVDK